MVVAAAFASSASGQGESRLVIAQGTDITSLDPAFSKIRNDDNVLLELFDTLVRRNDQMQHQPLLAENWKVLSPTRWQFKLRSGISFHNGEPFDAEAVKYSIERIYDPALNAPAFLKGFVTFERVEIVDPVTVNISTKTPASLMLDWLGYVYILAPKHYRTLTPQQTAQQAVGTGPYLFKEWVRDDHLTITANPRYWGPKAQIQTVVFRPIPETGTRVAELLSGGADILQNVPPDQIDRINRSGIATVKPVEGGRDIFLGMRNDRPMFKDRRVRQAMNYAIDVDTILKNVVGAGRRMASLANANVNPALRPYPYDPEKAKALLAEAGWKLETGTLMKDGQPFSISFDTPSGRYIRDKDIAEAAASYLERLGIRVKLNILAWPVYSKKMFEDVAPADLFLLGLGSSFNGQSEMQYISKTYAYNPVAYNNPEYEQTYQELNATADPAKRTQLLHKLQQMAYDDPPVVFLYKQIDFYGVNKRVNWEPRRDEFVILQGVTLK
jgi:peptide/nickel transport system substrate-binding protein